MGIVWRFKFVTCDTEEVWTLSLFEMKFLKVFMIIVFFSDVEDEGPIWAASDEESEEG